MSNHSDPQLSLLGSPENGLGYGAPEVLELTLLTSANLVSLLLMWYVKDHHYLGGMPEQLIAMIVGFAVGIASTFTGYDELTLDVTFNFSGIFFEFFLPCM